VLAAQIAALGIALVEVPIPAAASNAVYEQALAAALTGLRRRHPALRRLAFGDLFLADVRAYRERLLTGLDWEPLFPLWGRDTSQLAAEFVERGFRAILTCVDTTQLDAGFAGRDFDAELLAALPEGVDPCGENGEFHTCVHAGPIFSQPLALRIGEHVLRDNRFEYCDVMLDESVPARR
ncbi:MAG TPA: ATP-binding protein, partial [Rhodanobacteraceae bacterium]|jgi:diphthamide synthase (EF-2-diphthine--ammonia ligase)|nr:ATP-binding protein [Rhodanobacteraceae bacterium]